MMVPDRKAAAEFFAKLANTRYRWPILTEEEKADLIAEFKGFLAQRSQKLSKPWREQLGQMGKAAQPLMFVYLEDVAQTVWSTLYALLSGQSVRLSGGFVRVWWLKGRNIVVGLDPYEDEDDVSGGSLSGLSQLGIKEFYQLVEQHPFPFAQCRVCRRVFVQTGHGKPRQYCSATCKQKGIPSAATRTTDIRERRREYRRREIEQTRQILQRWPEERAYWSRLQKEFPRKSRRQLLYLIKQAKRGAQPRKKEE